MPGPRYFDPFDVVRDRSGQFAEKTGTAPESSLVPDAYNDAVAESERILREDVYDDGNGFTTRDVSIPVETLRTLLRGRVGQLAVDDPEVRAAHARARSNPELFTPAGDLP